MNIVLDTNVLIAAFISHGTCNEVLEHCIRYHNIISSEYIFEEFRDNLIQKFKFSRREASDALGVLLNRTSVVTPSTIRENVHSESKDKPILGTAIAGQCQCIVTGDKGLLTLRRYRRVDIISPQDYWKYERRAG